jgi:hypothetical protein
MDVNSAPRGELVRLIYEMADKINLLEGEIARLKEQLHEKGKGEGGSSNIPSFVKQKNASFGQLPIPAKKKYPQKQYFIRRIYVLTAEGI